MYKFFRWYNQNRLKFWILIIIVVLGFSVLQIANSLVAKHNEEQRNILANRNNYVDKTATPSPTNKSVLTGEKIPDTQDSTNKSIIKQFVDYCNDDKIQEAYDMLSDECKELLYPTVNSFNRIFIKNIFYIDRMYSLQNWFIDDNSYTYYIKYTEDVMATGNVNSDENKGDYITIVKEGGEYYLNISSFVGRQVINKSLTRQNVSLTVNWADMYINYTILNITATNNTEKTICLDAKEDTEATYIYDKNKVEYASLINENPMTELTIRDKMTQTLNIKFNKMYNKSRILAGIVFSDIVLNYDEYLANTAKKESISVDINI